ncbi:YggS family pyridoxal phosphate-dependent enzyme [Aquabacterium sp.]|uniref:YggS family pyridoxal phosphate-dependent enzyme n=1 Tax=Aquabacterium sp. TaxID=1872578 RepID=UPI002C9C1004|nr:YggS family pyridoxal phosphate-dependent enzyme [Aquabacterium sp.]HSW03754.1 YggS family pyridoxal phosphate-dependent enzyme [Aquabacterium sp.]
MTSVAPKLQQLRERMAQACAAAGRPVQEVTLLAVSKTFGPEAVREAVAAGQCAFGENYVQEALDKIAALATVRTPAGQPLEWHLIGPLQSNKTRVVAEAFDWVHTVDRLKIAQRLSEQRPPGRAPLQLCLQVNISGEGSKSGVHPDALPPLAQQVAALPNVRLRGLMAIPEPAADFAAQRLPHRALRGLMDQLNAYGLALDTLSMGMSADLEAAIAEGATIVRVGTAIFGGRPAVTACGR